MNVLAVIEADALAANTARLNDPYTSAATVKSCVRESAEARAAVADLIEAMRSSEAMAQCCMAVYCYSREEIADMARASVGMYAAALAKATGEGA